MSPMIIAITLFVLALIIGVAVIGRVPATLHTPLMSGANSIHGVVLVGVILVAAHSHSLIGNIIIFFAALLGTLNVVGGYVVTDRMLEMFKPKDQKKDTVDTEGVSLKVGAPSPAPVAEVVPKVETKSATKPATKATDEELNQMLASINAKPEAVAEVSSKPEVEAKTVVLPQVAKPAVSKPEVAAPAVEKLVKTAEAARKPSIAETYDVEAELDALLAGVAAKKSQTAESTPTATTKTDAKKPATATKAATKPVPAKKPAAKKPAAATAKKTVKPATKKEAK